jgi:hypothetical protein
MQLRNIIELLDRKESNAGDDGAQFLTAAAVAVVVAGEEKASFG